MGYKRQEQLKFQEIYKILAIFEFTPFDQIFHENTKGEFSVVYYFHFAVLSHKIYDIAFIRQFFKNNSLFM